jgi:Na+/proline symporter
MTSPTVVPNFAITFGLIAVFILGMISVLYATNRQSTSFTDYAVGGRSYGAFYIAMSYINSWWPGATFTAFFALSVSGVIGLYGVVYSTLGVTAMYLMAKRAWLWGKKYNLRTQPELLGMRYNSSTVKRIASLIGIICVLPWVVLGIQALALLIEWASFRHWSIQSCLLSGVLLILIRQYWTVRMGMRGLIMTDVYQGLIAYGLSALLFVFLMTGPSASFSNLAQLPQQMLVVPGDHGTGYGALYMFSIIFSGIIGSMCWPMSFQRIYTASGIKAVKKGTLLTIIFVGGFYALMSLFALCISQYPEIIQHPQEGFFNAFFNIGGVWLLAIAIVIVLAASIGHVDGCVQVCGTQFANDLMTWHSPRSDRQLTILAKSGMAAFIIVAAVLAYLTFNFSRLQLLAQISYQGIIQLAVPLFFGIFSTFGNKQGALSGMTLGIVVSLILTCFYPDDIPALGSLTSGMVGLGFNLMAFVLCGVIFKHDASEQQRLQQLFADAEPAPRQHPLDAIAMSTAPKP